jgi:DNA-binding beta-propeller fold protein YncE
MVVLCLTLVAALSAQVEVLVADRSTGTVAALDPGLTPIGTATLPASADPLDIAVNPARTLAAVANFSSNRVDFLDLTVSPPIVTGSSVSTTPLFPEDLVFSPDGTCLLISDGRPGSVASINVANRTVVTSLASVQSQAVEFIPNNPNNIVLTADQVGNVIHVLTLGAGCSLTNTGVTVATPGSAPKNITALPDGQRALVAHRDGTVGVLRIDGSTVSFTSSFVIGILKADPPFTSEVQSFSVLGSGSRAYAYQANKGNVEVLNIDGSDNVSDSGVGIPVSTNLAYLGVELIATDGDHVFVSTSTGVRLINVANNRVTSTIVTGSVPTGIAVTGSFPPHRLPPPHP